MKSANKSVRPFVFTIMNCRQRNRKMKSHGVGQSNAVRAKIKLRHWVAPVRTKWSRIRFNQQQIRRREPGRDGKILSDGDHMQDGNVSVGVIGNLAR